MLDDARVFMVAAIQFQGRSDTEARVIAAAAWDENNEKAWDVIGALDSPESEPRLKEHFQAPASRSADGIRRFVENGLKGYRMERPTPITGITATAVARAALVARGIDPYR